MAWYWWVLIILSPIILIVIECFILIAFRRVFKREKIPQGKHKIKKKSKLRRLFIEFPKAYVNDLFNRKPDFFPYSGVHIVCGEQGAGKTVTVAYVLREIKKLYPKVKICTNFGYKAQDDELTHWEGLVFKNNGFEGEIDVLDEIQNWFSSNESKDFPVEMLQEISQQRKQRKMIFGTAQVFERVAKPLREQAHFVYKPLTIFGCLTIVRVYKPKIDSDGQIKKTRMRTCFFFVHDEELRDCYDTYRKVERLAKGGFSPRDWQDKSVIVRKK